MAGTPTLTDGPESSIRRARSLTAACAAVFSVSCGVSVASDISLPGMSRPFAELKPTAVIQLGKTADWVVIAPNAVWVGSTGPNAVHRIDPATNRKVATVELSGEPCAGLAVGFGSLWVPLCGSPPGLAKVDLDRNVVTAVFQTGPPTGEGGVTTSSDSVWLVTDEQGTLVRIDPGTGAIRQTIRVPPGSYNPRFEDGVIWVTRAEGREVTSIDASTGVILGTTTTGPGPRFLTSRAGSVWTFNQGDGSLTRIDARSRQPIQSIALGTPGHGGDIAFGAGIIWTTMPKVPLSAVDAAATKLLCQWVGPGGDSLGIDHDAIWLTDYHGGTVSRLELKDAVSHCHRRPHG